MNRYSRAFRIAAGRVSRAASKTAREYADKDLPDEPNFTAALVTRIRDAVDGFHSSGISWKARILSSRTEEKYIGADFVGLLKLHFAGYAISKGFLAQAKRQKPGGKLSPSEWGRLVDQCNTMLAHSAESFVFVYALNGVVAVPAISVVACSGPEDLHTLNPKVPSLFYREHFECWIGERIDPIKPPPPWTPMDFPAKNGIEIIGEAKDHQ